MLTNISFMVAAASENMPFIQVFVVGFGTVFAGLLALILIITLLGAIMRLATKNKPAPSAPAVQAAPAAAPQGDRQAMVAAISAAIATVMGEDVSGIRILSIKKLND